MLNVRCPTSILMRQLDTEPTSGICEIRAHNDEKLMRQNSSQAVETIEQVSCTAPPERCSTVLTVTPTPCALASSSIRQVRSLQIQLLFQNYRVQVEPNTAHHDAESLDKKFPDMSLIVAQFETKRARSEAEPSVVNSSHL